MHDLLLANTVHDKAHLVELSLPVSLIETEVVLMPPRVAGC